MEGRPWQRLLALPFPMIAVDRIAPGVSMLGTIREAHSFFPGGQALIAYPEGSRQAGSDIAPFKRGAATLALALGRPVLPVFIEVPTASWPKGAGFLYRAASLWYWRQRSTPARDLVARPGEHVCKF